MGKRRFTRVDRFLGWARRERWWYLGPVEIEVAFEPRDLWVGVFWDHDLGDTDIYICPLPCCVLHLRIWNP